MRLVGSLQLGIPRPASPSRGGTSSNSAQAENPQILPFFLFFQSVFDSSHQLLFSQRPLQAAELHLFPLALIPVHMKFFPTVHMMSQTDLFMRRRTAISTDTLMAKCLMN